MGAFLSFASTRSRTGGQDQAILTYRKEGLVAVVRDAHTAPVVRARLIANGFGKGALVPVVRERLLPNGGQDQAILTYREEGRVPVVRDRLIANGGSGSGDPDLQARGRRGTGPRATIRGEKNAAATVVRGPVPRIS